MDVWNELKERFSQGDYIRISELQCEIFGLKQDSRSVSEFFTTLKVLWEELEAHLPTPVCACSHRCTCNTGVVNASISIRSHTPFSFSLVLMINLILYVLKSC